MNDSIEETKVIVYFCIPDQLLKKMQIPKKLFISSLLAYFNENSLNFQLIHNGKFVDPRSTFEQINFIDNEVLIATKKKNNDINSKIKKFQNDKSFEQKIKFLVNSKLRIENSRIMDIKYMKIEGNHRLFKKKTRRFLSKKKIQDDNKDESDLNINYKPLIEPCTEQMPVLW